MVAETEKSTCAQLATTDDLKRKFCRLKILIRNCDSRTKQLRRRLTSVCREVKTLKTERTGMLKKVKNAERSERRLAVEITKLKRKFPKKTAGKTKTSKTDKNPSQTTLKRTIPLN